MTPRGSRRRLTGGDGDDPISVLRETLESEERRRAVLKRAGLLAAALAVAASVGAVILVQGAASALGRSQTAQRVGKSTVAIAETVSVPATAQTSSEATEPSGSVTSPGPSSVRESSAVTPTAAKPAVSKPVAQKLSLAIGPAGYEPGVLRASTGGPIELTIGKGEGCAAGFLIPSLGIDKDNSLGPVTVNLGTVPAGRYQFSCGMEMVTGTLIVE